MKPMTLYAIIAAIALVLGGGGGWFIASKSTKADVAQAESDAAVAQAKVQQLEAAAATTAAASDVVKQAISEHLAKVGLTADVLSIERVRYACDVKVNPTATESGCQAFLLCAQVAGGTVQASACDAAVNEWVSERQLTVIESGDADDKRRDERRRTFERRK